MSRADKSRRFKIEVLPGGDEFESEHPSSAYGDPVNLCYLILGEATALAEKQKFLSDARSGVYRSKNSLGAIEQRINRLCRKYGVDPIGPDELRFDRPAPELSHIFSKVRIFDAPEEKKIVIPATRNAKFYHPQYGEVVHDDDLFDSFIDNWKSGVVGNDIIINAEHGRNGMLGGMALGWVDALYYDGGVFFISADPTKTGANVIGEEYRYASIEYLMNYVDQETGVSYGPTLVGCAVTNIPFVHRNQPVSINSLDKETTMDDVTQSDGAPVPTQSVDLSVPDSDSRLLSAQQLIASLSEEKEKLSQELRAARILASISEATSRGVAPVVLAVAAQLMSQCDTTAEKTISLDLGAEPLKLNFFEAVEALLKKAPGRDLSQITPPAESLDNTRTAPAVKTLEQAEAEAKAKRKKYNISVV